MILTGQKIEQEVCSKRIKITPFDSSLLNPNSYNFRLGDKIKTYKTNCLDMQAYNKCETIQIDQERGICLQPNRLYLGSTYEKMGSDFYVPLIGGRSSTGRLGLFVHITAPLGDIGYHGCWTLQLKATVPIRIYARQTIGQIIFVVPQGEIKLYQGKYRNKKEPQEYCLAPPSGSSLPHGSTA
jgi:dCTP deaminase